MLLKQDRANFAGGLPTVRIRMIIETKRTLNHLKATGLQIPFGLSSANGQLFGVVQKVAFLGNTGERIIST